MKELIEIIMEMPAREFGIALLRLGVLTYCFWTIHQEISVWRANRMIDSHQKILARRHI